MNIAEHDSLTSEDKDRSAPSRREMILAGIKSQNEQAEWEGQKGFWVQAECIFVPALTPMQAISYYREHVPAVSHNLHCDAITRSRLLIEKHGS